MAIITQGPEDDQFCSQSHFMFQHEGQHQDFDQMSVVHLFQYLFDTHQYLIKKCFGGLEECLVIVRKAEPDIPVADRQVIEAAQELEQFVRQHFRKEYELLYSDNIITSQKNLSASLEVILYEHSVIKRQLENLRNISNNYKTVLQLPRMKLYYAMLFNLEQDIHKHIFLQEDVLFPKLLKS